MTKVANNQEEKQRVTEQEQTDDTAAADMKADAQEAAAEESPQSSDAADGEDEERQEAQPEETEEDFRQQIQAQKDKYIRLMAEFDNYKRRTGKEYERIIESANERLMCDIIEVRESFERALKVDEQNSEFKTFFDGMKLIFSKLDEVLSKNGLSVFTEIGDEFDPQIHDAMMKVASENIPEDHIAEIYEKGYRLRNHVIKHAKVIVSSGKPEKGKEDKQAETDS